MLKIKGGNAIVTGAGSGIGRALALRLAGMGANVAITDIVGERLEPVEREIRGLGVKAFSDVVDHSDPEAVATFHEKYESEWGRADVLCLNAGITVAGPIEELTREDWTRTFGVNLWGPIYMLELFLPQMIKQNSGGVLITASAAGFMGLPALSTYSTSKYAMVGLAESLHLELSKHGIHVCALCPGVINTNIVADGKMRFDKGDDPKTQDKLVRFYATYGTSPETVAKHGIQGLVKNRCVQPSPAHASAMYYIKRFFPVLYCRIGSLVWKKGWAI